MVEDPWRFFFVGLVVELVQSPQDTPIIVDMCDDVGRRGCSASTVKVGETFRMQERKRVVSIGLRNEPRGLADKSCAEWDEDIVVKVQVISSVLDKDRKARLPDQKARLPEFR